ncbi:MAG: cobalt ECF transporter T component CbiQ [Clostridiales bacterium]|nr:cobalt ECF transporter T component CbiQ [Clostridiales bacterium]
MRAGEAIGAMLALEELAAGDGAMHRLHPAAKLLGTAAYLVCAVSVGRLDYPTMSLFFFYPAIAIALSGVPMAAIGRRVLPALPLVLFVGLSGALLERETYVALGPLAISRGVVSMAVLLEKAALSVSAALILMATTPLADLLGCLRRAGAPKALVAVLMLAARYLSLIFGEAGRMSRAYALRAGKARGVDFRDMGSFLGQLLLRSIDRAERVYAAMKLRGYDGDFPAPAGRHFGVADAGFVLAVAASSVLMRFLPLAEWLGRLT